MTALRSFPRDFLRGISLLVRGFRLWGSSPRLMALGAIPAFIVGAIFTAALVAFALTVSPLAEWATPFADRWNEPYRSTLRITTAVAAVALGVLLIVYVFTAVTLIVGDPFYERIWATVEEGLGGRPPELRRGFWRPLGRSVRDSAVLLLFTGAVGLCLFLGGLLPLVGQTVVPVLAAGFGGWILALELTGFAFEARGRGLSERRRALGAHRAMSLGFGTASYLLLLIPGAAVLVMPAASAGATLLARAILADESQIGQAHTPPTG